MVDGHPMVTGGHRIPRGYGRAQQSPVLHMLQARSSLAMMVLILYCLDIGTGDSLPPTCKQALRSFWAS